MDYAPILKEWAERAHERLTMFGTARPIEQLTDVRHREISWIQDPPAPAVGMEANLLSALGALQIDMQAAGGRLADNPAGPIQRRHQLLAEHVIGGVRAAVTSDGKDVFWGVDITYRCCNRAVAEGRAREFAAAAARVPEVRR
jgi:hypothetical protein